MELFLDVCDLAFLAAGLASALAARRCRDERAWHLIGLSGFLVVVGLLFGAAARDVRLRADVAALRAEVRAAAECREVTR